MDIQHKVRLLVRTIGPRLLEDSSEFHAALDDYLEQDDMSSGEMNSLIDAVRLGAYAHLIHLLNSGAPPDAAIITAGDALSEKRGGDNPAGCRWACACLGFAANRIDDATLSRFPYPRTAMAPATHATPPPLMPPPQPVGRHDHGGANRSWMWVFAVVAVLAAALGASALALELDDDAPPAAVVTTTATSPTAEDATEPTATADHHDDESSSPDEIVARYAALGDFEAVIDPAICHGISVLGGQDERLGCFNQQTDQEFDLYLTHYVDEAALQAARGRLPSAHVCQTAVGMFVGIVRNENVRVYWDDSEDLVSARLTGAEHHLEDIHAAIEGFGAPIEPCELPEASGSDHHEEE